MEPEEKAEVYARDFENVYDRAQGYIAGWLAARGDAGWTCFHCGETFTTIGAARDHFGATSLAEPGCLVKVALAERGLLMALRKTEEQLARYMAEDNDLQRLMHAQQCRHSNALRTAEEAGYERGLRDAIRVHHEAARKE